MKNVENVAGSVRKCYQMSQINIAKYHLLSKYFERYGKIRILENCTQKCPNPSSLLNFYQDLLGKVIGWEKKEMSQIKKSHYIKNVPFTLQEIQTGQISALKAFSTLTF